GILGDLRLIGRDDVHDDAALKHLGETLLRRPRGGFDCHVGCVLGLIARVCRPGWPRGPRPFESAGPPRAIRIIARAPSGPASALSAPRWFPERHWRLPYVVAGAARRLPGSETPLRVALRPSRAASGCVTPPGFAFRCAAPSERRSSPLPTSASSP